MNTEDVLHTCPFCGAFDTKRLGECVICRHTACYRCGNVQFTEGERRIAHRECLRRDDGGFKMIKFVR